MFLDLKDGFWHVNISNEDREKTAFITTFGLFEWLVMPFGLCNAPATFQALMEEILSDMRDFTSGLLDDIAIWGDTIEQLYQRAMLLFAQLAKYGMILNTGKSKMFVKKLFTLIAYYKNLFPLAPLQLSFTMALVDHQNPSPYSL